MQYSPVGLFRISGVSRGYFSGVGKCRHSMNSFVKFICKNPGDLRYSNVVKVPSEIPRYSVWGNSVFVEMISVGMWDPGGNPYTIVY